jgi:Tfp pilus assembly protein PilP
MADKMFENIPGKPSKNDSGTVKSTATKLPAKIDPNKPSQTVLESLKNERENQEQDIRNRKEREAYEKYDKNRLRDQGSLKKGGAVKSASARADGCAIRGKTRA